MPRFQKSTTSRVCGTISSSRHILKIRGAISTVLRKPASGGKPGDTGGHSVRVGIVLGLADVFFEFGQAHTARCLYNLYTQLRVFAYRRANTRPKCRISADHMPRVGLWWR